MLKYLLAFELFVLTTFTVLQVTSRKPEENADHIKVNPKINECQYTRNPNTIGCPMSINIKKCYYAETCCENNIWFLAEKIEKEYPNEINNCYIIFISNYQGKDMPLWKQQNGEWRTGLKYWDYHCVLVYTKGQKNSWVFDFDSKLDFPETFDKYSAETLKEESTRPRMLDGIIPSNRRRFYRVVKAKNFLRTYNPEAGPTDPDPEKSPLYRYVKMDPKEQVSEDFGQVLYIEDFLNYFC